MSAADTQYLTRAGHIPEVDLDRIILDEGTPEFRQAMDAHLQTCSVCSQALEAARADYGSIQLEPRLPQAAPAPEPRNNVIDFAARRRQRMRRAVTVGAPLLALAAAALLFFGPNPRVLTGADAGISVKGGDFDLQVWADREDGAVQLSDGDKVLPGERLGFRTTSKAAGYLLIVGADSGGQTYPCFPKTLASGAAPLTASEEPQTLETAIRFDDSPGQETLQAVWCPVPFATVEQAEHPDCVRRSVTLSKANGTQETGH